MYKITNHISYRSTTVFFYFVAFSRRNYYFSIKMYFFFLNLKKNRANILINKNAGLHKYDFTEFFDMRFFD